LRKAGVGGLGGSGLRGGVRSEEVSRGKEVEFDGPATSDRLKTGEYQGRGRFQSLKARRYKRDGNTTRGGRDERKKGRNEKGLSRIKRGISLEDRNKNARGERTLGAKGQHQKEQTNTRKH